MVGRTAEGGAAKSNGRLMGGSLKGVLSVVLCGNWFSGCLWLNTIEAACVAQRSCEAKTKIERQQLAAQSHIQESVTT